jgi:hypothetical protein
MKKIFSLLLISAFALSLSAQQGYRYTIVPGIDNRYLETFKEVKAIAFASTITVAPTQEETTYDFATLTGAMTVNATLTPCFTGDRMACMFLSNGSDRIVTFNTGFTANGTLTVPASNRSIITFVFNGVKWIETSRNSNGGFNVGLFANGTAAAPSITFASSKTDGFYLQGTHTLALTSNGVEIAQFNPTQLSWLSGSISAATNMFATDFVASGVVVNQGTVTTYTTTANVTAAAVAGGVIAYTGSAHTLTLPSTAAIVAALPIASQGSHFDFVVDNSGGSGTVTLALDASMTAVSAVTGGTTLTLAQSTTAGTSGYRITFISGTVSIISRLY